MTANQPTNIPAATLYQRVNGQNQVHASQDLFSGQKVVLFAVPAAFTPTCSNKHLPGYEQAYAELTALGVDRVICLSVNDGWVMDAWGQAVGVNKVQMMADGNAEFTLALGMHQDLSKSGFATRSKRYSMLVIDGQIEKMFAETSGFEVSDAQTMLEYLSNR